MAPTVINSPAARKMQEFMAGVVNPALEANLETPQTTPCKKAHETDRPSDEKTSTHNHLKNYHHAPTAN